jgi:hypothetical protein
MYYQVEIGASTSFLIFLLTQRMAKQDSATKTRLRQIIPHPFSSSQMGMGIFMHPQWLWPIPVI